MNEAAVLPEAPRADSEPALDLKDLWVREPDSGELNKSKVSGHLCSCDNVCLAVIEHNAEGEDF